MMGEFMTGVLNTSAVVGLSIVVFLLLLSFSGKAYSAKCRKTIWILMAVCLLIPFRLITVSGVYTAEIPHVVLREADVSETGHTVDSIADSAGGGSIDQTLLQYLTSGVNPQRQFLSGVSGREITAADVFFVIWACVGTAMAVYYILGYWRMQRKLRRWGYDCEDEDIRRILMEVSGQYRMKRIPELRILQEPTAGPFTTGVFRNIIVLPDEAQIESDMRFILKHEVLHCKNKDILWKLLFLFVNIIHWFNPLVWMLRRVAEQDMEIACDEEVVLRATREDREEYSEVIMSWVVRSQYRGSTVSTGYVHGVRFLKRRFDSIINGGRKKKGILLIGAACALIMLVGNTIHVRSGEKEVGEDPVRMQVFAPEEMKFTPEIVPDDFESACEMGEVRQMRDKMMPGGGGEGTWYIVTIDGVEYYYGRYDFLPDRTELFGFAIVSRKHPLANGISVGMTKSEIIKRFPAMAIQDMEGNILNEVIGCLGWYPGGYPASAAGMDENMEYVDGKDYRWEDQFDYVMIADVEQPLDTLPVYVVLMMKGDVVVAITFYYPTAG